MGEQLVGVQEFMKKGYEHRIKTLRQELASRNANSQTCKQETRALVDKAKNLAETLALQAKDLADLAETLAVLDEAKSAGLLDKPNSPRASASAGSSTTADMPDDTSVPE